MEIRAKTISFGIIKKRETNEKEKEIEQDIQRLDNESVKNNSIVTQLQEKKDELQNLRKAKIDGIALRSRARWASHGEKINKYFCNMEKRHFISKQMFKLTTDQGITLTETSEMLKETRKYYMNLYDQKQVQDIDLGEYVKDMPKLNDFESNSLEGCITYQEATEALKNMDNDKSPGTDGFTVNFFNFFWKDLGIFVVRSINEGFLKWEMSITQKE